MALEVGMSPTSVRTLATAALLVALLSAGASQVWAEAPRSTLPTILYELQVRLDQERFSEGLDLAQLALERYPRNLDLQYAEALCLAGLHRYVEAVDRLELLAERNPGRHDIRFTYADCLFYMGKTEGALREYARFYTDPVSREAAYVRSVKLHLATGQEAKARNVLAEGLARLNGSSEDLLRFQLDLENHAPEALEIIRKLLPYDREGARGFAALEQLYTAAGDAHLFQQDPLPGGGGVVVPLERHMDPRDSTTVGIAGNDSFRLSEPPTPVLTCPVSINGSATEWLMLDSGSPLVFLSPVFAETLHLEPVAGTQYRGLGQEGERESAWVIVDELKVGPVTFRKIPAVLLDRSASFWNTTPGIIPLSLFNKQAIVYDPDEPSLTLYPSGTDPEQVLGDGEFRVRALWLKGCPFAQAKVAGHEELYFLVDTGSFPTILARSLYPSLALKTTSAKADRGYQAGLSGGFSYLTAYDVRFCISRSCTTLSSAQVTPVGLRYGIPAAGLMGRSVLDRYRIFFDYTHNALFFRPCGR